MSSSPAPSPSNEVLDQMRLWAASLSAESSSPAASPVTWEVFSQTLADVSAPADSDVWIMAKFSGVPTGELGFRMSPSVALSLLREPETANATLTAEQTPKLVEFFRKVANRVTTQSNVSGQENFIQVEVAGPPTWEASTKYWLQARLPAEVRIEAQVRDVLVGSLRPVSAPTSIDPCPDAVPAKLGMFMDVELVVSMRFGGRRMLLKDILDLCTGSIVELDQHVQEPVDLLLDGKLIARGEVVVVDGNYGLRVTQIVSVPAS